MNIDSRIFFFTLVFIFINITVNTLVYSQTANDTSHTVKFLFAFPSSEKNSTYYFARLTIMPDNPTLINFYKNTIFYVYLPNDANHSVNELESTSTSIENFFSQIPVFNSFVSKPPQSKIASFLNKHFNDIYAEKDFKINTTDALTTQYAIEYDLYIFNPNTNTTTELHQYATVDLSYDYIVTALNLTDNKFDVLELTNSQSSFAQFKLAISTLLTYLRPAPINLPIISQLYTVTYVLLFLILIVQLMFDFLNAIKP